MGFMYEFPHTRVWDSDLREIIDMIKPLETFYKEYATVISNIVDYEKIFPLTVKSYGAKGDGITDDTAAIIECLNKQHYVIFTPGTYRVTSLIDFNNKSIIGVNATLYATNNGRFRFDGCNVLGLHFASVDTGTLTTCSAINNGTIFKDCIFNPTTIGLEIGASNTSVINCRFHGNSRANFGIWADAQNIQVEKVVIDNCYFESFNLNAIFGFAKQLVITNSKFTNNHLQTAPTGGGQIDIVKYDSDESYAETIIDNCSITGGNSVTSGVEVEGSNVIISNSYIKVPFYGIALQNAVSAVINANNISECTVGVNVSSNSHFKITNNRIMNNTTKDIRLQVAINDSIITGNLLSTDKEQGLSLSNTLFNGICKNNYPTMNNYNLATASGSYNFTVKNNRPTRLKIFSQTNNLYGEYIIGSNGVDVVSDKGNLLDNKFSLSNDGTGNWTLTILPSTVYMFIQIDGVL